MIRDELLGTTALQRRCSRQKMGDLVWKAWKGVPQGLKPSYAAALYGTAKPVLFVQRLRLITAAERGCENESFDWFSWLSRRVTGRFRKSFGGPRLLRPTYSEANVAAPYWVLL